MSGRERGRAWGFGGFTNCARGGGAGCFVLAVFLSVFTLSGCSGAAQQNQFAEASDAYRAGRFQESFAKSEEVAKASEGVLHDRAALIAGQSAQAMSKTSEAEKWLRPLLNNADKEVSGNANATLGLIAFNARRYAAAAPLLNAASVKLQGDDAARAALYAGSSSEQMGQTVQAKASFTRALASAQDPSLKRTIQDRLTAGPYTIQLGAFQSRDKAALIGRQHAPAATRAGLPAPLVKATPLGGGSQLFAVQVGMFASRPTAETAMARAGLPGVVVSAARN
ncbi:hypothetical protein BH11PLA1_BH11PLA1_11010 [soil metagenome]